MHVVTTRLWREWLTGIRAETMTHSFRARSYTAGQTPINEPADAGVWRNIIFPRGFSYIDPRLFPLIRCVSTANIKRVTVMSTERNHPTLDPARERDNKTPLLCARRISLADGIWRWADFSTRVPPKTYVRARIGE